MSKKTNFIYGMFNITRKKGKKGWCSYIEATPSLYKLPTYQIDYKKKESG